jgi:hypothetical protein
LYKRCRETLNGSLSRVKEGAGLVTFSRSKTFKAE